VNSLPRGQQLEFGQFLVDLKRRQAAAAVELIDRTRAVGDALVQVQNGQTIPSEEIDAWIDSWDTPNELPKPTPRNR
jgi:hypothetical protein